MIVFDTEDDSAEVLAAGKSGFAKRVTQIAAMSDSGETFYNTGNVKEFIEWQKELEDKEFWAFNTAYDVGNLCNSPSQGLKLYDFDVTMVKGRFIKGKHGGRNYFDVHNLTGAGSSVGKLGLAVGLPKFGFEYTPEEMSSFPKLEQEKYRKFKKMTDAQRFRNKEYVLRDCEIPLQWLKFVQQQCLDLGIENIPATLGGLCTKFFEAMGFENWFEASDQSAQALKGGRVELFSGGGRGNIIYTDINSLYPWCMTQKFPTCIENLHGKLDGYGIAECIVTVPRSVRVAPLPFHDDEGRMIFPVGRFKGVWTFHELRAAQELCGVKIEKVNWSYGSREGESYYRDYVLHFYNKRLAAKNEAEKLFYKLLMNNLYGRLAIGGEVTRSMNLTPENCGRGIPYGTKVLLEYKMPLPAFTNYLHAAHVLAYARVHLLRHLLKVPPESLIYCDTDSMIFFWPRGKDLPFPVSKELGAMKLEAVGSRCETFLPKTYLFDDIYKAKGVPKKHAKEFIERGMVEFDLPFKLRESIRFFDADNSRKLSVWRRVEKIRHETYSRKRISGNYYLPKIVKMA